MRPEGGREGGRGAEREREQAHSPALQGLGEGGNLEVAFMFYVASGHSWQHHGIKLMNFSTDFLYVLTPCMPLGERLPTASLAFSLLRRCVRTHPPLDAQVQNNHYKSPVRLFVKGTSLRSRRRRPDSWALRKKLWMAKISM